jgi:hypothetical protein
MQIIKSIGIFCLLLLAVAACHTPVKGCLELAATNFDASADKNCCCEYPKLVFNIDQYFGDSDVYIPGKLVEWSPGNLGRLNSVVFYLSDFQVQQNDEFMPVTDTIRLKTYPNSASQLFTNDFQLVRRIKSPKEYKIGEFREGGSFSAVKFSLGLSETANQVIATQAPSGHPLQTQEEYLWLNQTDGYVFLQIILTRDTAASTLPDTLNFTKADFAKKEMNFTGDFTHKEGYDFTLLMNLNFKPWFEGIDWVMDDQIAIKSKIVQNLPNAFHVVQ